MELFIGPVLVLLAVLTTIYLAYIRLKNNAREKAIRFWPPPNRANFAMEQYQRSQKDPTWAEANAGRHFTDPEVLLLNYLNEKVLKYMRFEVIDESGRAYVKYDVDIEFFVQDDNKTLKVFVVANED